MRALGSYSRFSATSVDQLPHMLTAFQLFGHQLAMPVPDLDRTHYLLILGANPAVSNGSIMTAPGMRQRLKDLRARGGKVVVVDPRRTETAELADEHHFIRPGTDALFFFAMLHTIFAEHLERPRLLAMVENLELIRQASRAFAPEVVAAHVGIEAGEIRRITREFARAPSAASYPRMGSCTQEFGGLSTWLSVVLDVVTGNLDAPGGKMFTSPAVDLVELNARLGSRGGFGRFKTRVRGLPEFGGELPVAALAEEIETDGERRIRALVTMAGNPVLSAPNGPAVDRALSKLDFMVSIDLYLNETTRHADLILPPTFGFERDHYDAVFYVLSVRNIAKYAPALFAPAGQTRADFDITTDLARRIATKRKQPKLTWLLTGLRLLGSTRLLDLLLRFGPHRLSVSKLKSAPHGIDLGPLQPRLVQLMKGRRIDLAPALYMNDVPRLAKRLERSADDSLRLIGRRALRSNNSWMHNSDRLSKGSKNCTLLMHPTDAASRSLVHGEEVVVRSRTGEVRVPLEVTDSIAPGVVSLPHGWGHHREGSLLRIAQSRAGASINDLTDETLLDSLTGNAAFNGVPVSVMRQS